MGLTLKPNCPFESGVGEKAEQLLLVRIFEEHCTVIGNPGSEAVSDGRA